MNTNRFIWLTTVALCALMGAVGGWLLGTFYVRQLGLHSDYPAVLNSLGATTVVTITVGLTIVAARVGSWLANRRLIPLLGGLHRLSAADRVLGIIGALMGLIFGVLVTLPLPNDLSNARGVLLPVKFCIMAVCAAVGMAMLQGMRAEMLRVLPQLEGGSNPETPTVPKLLDTNVIIDGRIADLCKTGFLEGPLFVPHFVLEEVQYIADSSDSMRRARGRRGLEVLNTMREMTVAQRGRESALPNQPKSVPLVHMLNEISPEVRAIETVDSKLVFLAKEMGGSIVTNDFNLNRVAGMQGVPVLNINELAQALKPVVLPGEEMNVSIVKEGKEAGQGVAYLDDGTMIVVGDGQAHIGETCKVTISSVYQTVAGKMIFAELKGLKGAGDDLFNGNNSNNNHGGKKHDDDFANRPGGGMRRKNRS